MAKLVATVIVPGRPVPKARARVTSRGRYTPKRTRAAEREIRQNLQVALRGWQATGPVDLEMKFYFHVRRVKVPQPRTKQPDLDNLIKLVVDALKPWLRDDAVVSGLRASKMDTGEPSSTVITIWE